MELSAALRDLTFVAFDTETTGLEPSAARMVEIAGVKFTLGSGVLGTYQSLIYPGIPIPAAASAVHRIYDAEIAEEPHAGAVLTEFFQFVGGLHVVLIAHNVPFDRGFLQAEAARHSLPPCANPFLCTLALSRRYVRGLPNYRLATVATHFQAAMPAQLHRAQGDAHLALQVFVRLLATLPPEQVMDLLQPVCTRGIPQWIARRP